MLVRLEALSLLVRHGEWASEPLSLHVVCSQMPRPWEGPLARVRALLM